MRSSPLQICGFFLILIWSACNGVPADMSFPEGRTAEEFIIEPTGRVDVHRARRYNDKGLLIEEGYLVQGKPNGSWLKYDVDRITELSSYVDGILHGVQIQFSKREQVDEKSFYVNGLKNGRSARFEFGRLIEEVTYKNGKMEGVLYEYHRTGNVKKEVHYKNGLQHGLFRYYDPDGNLTLEYEYRDGEKVSGGIVPE